MKGWKFVKPLSLIEEEITDNYQTDTSIKVKITKALLNINDLHRFNGEIEIPQNTVIGSYGIGIVSEVPENLTGINKGDKVFIESKSPCKECYNCNNGNKEKCFSPLVAGEDYDGFLRDFVSLDVENVYQLPDSVQETDALFINYISIAENIIDTLKIDKGMYVAIVGTNNFSIILAQLLMYYQAVPIMVCTNDEEKQTCLNNGIYYAFTTNDVLPKEISSVTGGRMADNIVYISDSAIPVIKAFSIASFGAQIAFTGFSNKVTSFSFNQALKKQLKIYCINESAKNTPTCINLLVNKAVSIEHLTYSTCKYSEVQSVLTEKNKTADNSDNFNEIIVDML